MGVPAFAPGDEQLSASLRGALSDFQKLDYGFLFPLRRFFSRELLGSKALRMVAVFGLAPLAILLVVEKWDLEFRQAVWLVSAYFCYFWAICLRNLISPAAQLGRSGTGYFFFTLFLGIPLLLAWHKMPVVSTLLESTESEHFLPRSIGFVAGVGVFEELCKALPLLLFAFRKGPLAIRHGIYLGAMSGLGFALAEVVQYSVTYWQQSAALSALAVAEAADRSINWTGGMDSGEFGAHLSQLVPDIGEHLGTTMLVQVVRFIPLPLLHAVWAGVAGWFIAVASQRSSGKLPVIVVGLGFVALIHGFYDVFAAGYLGLGLAAFSIIAFFCYLLHGEEAATVTPPEPSAP